MSRGSELALKRIAGNVATGDKRMAWFYLPPQRWSFRSTAEREGLILGGATRYSQLTGRWLHLRATTRPYPVEQWARRLDENTPDPLPFWTQHLRAEQLHVLGLTLADKQVFLGVELQQPAVRRHASEEELRDIENILEGPGFNARHASPQEFEYLLHRSCSLGAPAPLTLASAMDEWESEDVSILTDRVNWTALPYGRVVRITADVNDVEYTRYVCVLTLNRMSELSIPEKMEPWMQRSDRLFPVEWSVRAHVVESQNTKNWCHDKLDRIRSQVKHYAEHELDPPNALERQRTRALEVEDEVSSANELATRVECWVRAAVSGATPKEALERAHALVEIYQPMLTFARGAAQYKTAREFIPGEPLANTAHKRRMPVTTFASGIPAVTAMVGDRVGDHIGSTAGASERAVCWDMWRSMEIREGSGLTVIAGGLGAGKSTLIGALAYQTGIRHIRTILLDPSGPLARLCTMPELRDHARAVDLMSAEPGALSPYRVIGDPVRDQFDSDDEYMREVKLCAARRRTLCLDVLLMLLPASVSRQPETRKVLMHAVHAVPTTRMASARQVITNLQNSTSEHAQYIALELLSMGDMPQTQLIFPAGDELPEIGADDWIFQVLTMRGLVLPKPNAAQEEWLIEERLGVPLLHLASHLTAQHVYTHDMDERKLVGLDELHALTRVGSGASLVNSVSRDSRKRNLRVLLASQNAADSTTAGIGNFLDSSFIGRTTDFEAQQDALRVLRIELNSGYEAILGGLSPLERLANERSGFREFIFNDGDGGIEKIRIHVPERLRSVLDTTADPRRIKVLQESLT